MKADLALMDGIAAIAGATGLVLLLKPGVARRLLGIGPGEPATYGLRIAGAMFFALGLFLGGFATAFSLASGA